MLTHFWSLDDKTLYQEEAKQNFDNVVVAIEGESIVVDNLLQRTHELLIRSDAIIFLPGGIETIVELFSALAYIRSNKINVPILSSMNI